MVFYLMPFIFLTAILCIAFEDKIKINKAAIAISSSVILWGLLFVSADSILGAGYSSIFNKYVAAIPSIADLPIQEQYYKFLSEFALINNLGDVSTTLFFIIGSMLIVEIVDNHGGFNFIINMIKLTKLRSLLIVITIIAFLLSSVLDDLAAAVVMIAILRKFVQERNHRLIFGSMIVIAANAGGCWSPIGDVTTLLLWTGGNLTPIHQITSLFIPAIVACAVPLVIALRYIGKDEAIPIRVTKQRTLYSLISNRAISAIFIIGILSLVLVPFFNEITGLPPFMGIMFGLSILWMFTDLMYTRLFFIKEQDRNSVAHLLPKIDMSSIMFFFGILMSVGALNTAGQLSEMSNFLDSTIHNPELIAFLLGLCSSFLDNVALVAGTMGMYSIQNATTDPYLMNFVVDGKFWTFLAYCCVTGGSIFIIGSATGVAIMGMEKIKFSYYFKKFTLLALAGYIAGALVYIFL